MSATPTYRALSMALGVLERAETEGSRDAIATYESRLAGIMGTAPSGSGIDAGVELLRDESSPEKLTFQIDFRHMNDSGFYDGWTRHRAIVRPSLQWRFDVKITGRDRRGIKGYLGEVLGAWLESPAVNETGVTWPEGWEYLGVDLPTVFPPGCQADLASLDLDPDQDHDC